jgi:hypothetical protein
MKGNMQKANVVALLMVLSVLLPFRERLFGQESTAQKIVFHVTAVRSGHAGGDWCSSGDCIATRFTVEGYSDIGGDLHLTEYALECVQTIPLKLTPNSVLVKCPRLHPNNDYESSIDSAETEESMCFGLALCYTIVSEKEAIKQNKAATPCVSNRPLAHPTRPK